MKNLYPPETLGDKIRYLRLKKGLKQNELAKLLGIHKTAVFQYEMNRPKTNPENFKKSIELLDTTKQYLVREY